MKLFKIFLCSLIAFVSIGQNNKLKIFTINYTHQFPIGKLSERFGDNSSIGISYINERKQKNFYGVETNFLFGDNVKYTNIFENITTINGAHIGANGQYANVNLMQRGFDAYIIFGYILQTKNLSGLYFSSGLGFLQHKIFIDTKNQNLPQLNEQYKKGYDRLTSGFSSKWEMSYKYFSPKGRFQISTGLNIILAYTKNRRPYLFDQQAPVEDNMRWDNLIGLSLGVIIPIKRANDEKFHYF